MKILLANPATRQSIDSLNERFFIKAGSRWPWTIIKKKTEKNSNIFFPFYLAYSAQILKNLNHEIYVIDGVALDLTDGEFLKKAKGFSPEMVVIETTTHAVNFDVKLAGKIKKLLPGVLIIFVGPHVTVFAKEVLKNNAIDFVVRGEYEFVLAELVRRISKKHQNFKIDGAGFRNGKKIWVSEKKGFIEDINKLPYPAFGMFPLNEKPDISIYGDGICTYKPAVTLHSSRGCPFGCDFCLWNQIMYDNRKYRTFTPKRVVDEMEYVIKNFGAKEIYFDDDDFCVDKKHVLAICREIKKKKLAIKWSCMGDAMSSDEEMIREMASTGCIFMKFGVESGSTDILKNIGKPLKPKQAIETAELCRKYGIRSHATFMFGLDGETLKTMNETLQLANKIKFDYAQVSIATPFPGTRYYEKLKKRGHLRVCSFEDFDGTSKSVVKTDKLDSKEIENFRQKAVRSMVFHKFLDPVWVWHYLGRSTILVKNFGLKAATVPIKAFWQNLFGSI